MAMRRTSWPAASCRHDNKLDSVYCLLMQMPITYYVFAIGGKVHHGKQVPAYYCRKGGGGGGGWERLLGPEMTDLVSSCWS